MVDGIRVACSQCKAEYHMVSGVEPGQPVACPKCGQKSILPPAQDAETASVPATLAGSPDDREVTLAPVAMEESTQVWEGQGPSVEAALRGHAAASGRYVEQGVIGQGGMGEIVLCIDRDIRRPVAMKRMLTATAADPNRRARFVEEAQVTGQLEHPNIVPVHELARSGDGSVYFTMKLVKGRSLAEIIRDMKEAESGKPPLGKGGYPQAPSPKPSGLATQKSLERGFGENLSTDRLSPSSLSDLLLVFLKVCDGVAFAHSRGVLHRDLKPANIMVGDFGEVLVMDWGLAKVVGREDIRAEDLVQGSRRESAHAQTLDGSAIGTPAYMSPEQAHGELDKVDHRSDIYSLGAILYEMLTLGRAVEGETPMMVLVNAVKGKITPPEQRAPDRHVPRELSAVAMKCLSKNRASRYQSVTGLRRDIGLFLEGRSVSAQPDSFGQAIVKLVKRNKGVSASIAGAAVLLIALTGFFLIRLKGERDTAVKERKAAQVSEGRAVAAQEQQRATGLAASESLAMQAIRAAEEGRLAEADVRADAAVKVLPDGPWGDYALAMVARERNDPAGARKHLDAAISHDPGHVPSKAALAALAAADGDLAKASALLGRLDEVKDARSLAAVGRTLMLAGRYDEAIKAYGKALALMESDPTQAPKALEGKRAELEEARYELERARVELACQGFPESIRKLPAEQQVGRILAKLAEIHGEPVHFSVAPGTENGVVTKLALNSQPGLHWLQPLRGMALASLSCSGTGVRDLNPLRGMPLTELNITNTSVRDLSPLRGMPLSGLEIMGTAVHDLSPLRGMPLKRLHIDSSSVSDLGALTGMRLESLTCPGCPVRDLAPLRGMPLTFLDCSYSAVSDLSPLQGMPLKELLFYNCRGVTDLSPLKGAPLTSLECGFTGVTDLSPLKGMPLKKLFIGATGIADLTPLAGMPLRELRCQGTAVKDFSPLKGSPLEYLDCYSTAVIDLSSLKGLPLTSLHLESVQVADLNPLKGMRLKSLNLRATKVTDLSLLGGMPLEWLDLGGTEVSDLAPLKGVPLKQLLIENCPRLTDLSPLEGMELTHLIFTPANTKKGIEVIRRMKSLEAIDVKGPVHLMMKAAEFWKKFDTGEFSK